MSKLNDEVINAVADEVRKCLAESGILELIENLKGTFNSVKQAMDLIYHDAHYWSTRPCPTCTTVSNLLKIEFGCVRKRAEEEAKGR